MRLATFNARSESVADKRMFSESFAKRRCLIPASGYYEWLTTPEGKQPYYFTRRGRLVAITGANLSPDNPAWREDFIRLQERGRVAFSAAIDGRVYARHGTSTDTRLTVIDRVPPIIRRHFPPHSAWRPTPTRCSIG